MILNQIQVRLLYCYGNANSQWRRWSRDTHDILIDAGRQKTWQVDPPHTLEALACLVQDRMNSGADSNEDRIMAYQFRVAMQQAGLIE